MIDSIKNRVWNTLKGKEVSLAMLFDREGRILWQRGRKISGRSIEEGDGFCKSSIRKTLEDGSPVHKRGVAVILCGDDLPQSAITYYIKSLLILPVSEGYFLYLDSGVKEEFSDGDIQVFGVMGELLGEIIDKIRANESPAGSICGVSPAMRSIREQVAKYSLEEEPILISGETGVGKNHIAEAIHRLSGRRGQFVIVHTPAVPENLFESELFGHVRGAFTDARENRRGLLEEADGGTLFLDEIAEIPSAVQTKLLRFIESRRYRTLGDSREREADVRLITATNRNLAEETKSSTFRRDLYYRLNVLNLLIPPLRERMQDLRPLVAENSHLLRGKQLGEEAWRKLVDHSWPGNVRELIHVLKRAGIILEGPVIGAEIADILEYGTEDDGEAWQGEIDSMRAAIAGGQSFWDTAWRSFLGRDWNRHQLRLLLEDVYCESGHNLKATAHKLNIRDEEYPRFISMLHRYDIHPKKV